jgi:hypothetical protein
MPSSLRLLACAAIVTWTSGCVWIVHRVDVTPVAAHTDTLTTTAPVKVHLRDGSIIMYPRGVAIVADTLRGAGTHYDRTVTNWLPVTRVPADSVAAMEVFDTSVDEGASLLASGLSTTVLAAGLYLVVSNIHISFSGAGAAAAGHP